MIMWGALMQVLPVLEVTPTERVLRVVQAFMETEEYKAYVEDAEVSMGIVRYNVVQVTHVEQSAGNDFLTVHVCPMLYVQGVLDAEERLRRVREALRAEKDAHARTREAHARTREAHERTLQELEELKRVMERLSAPTETVGANIGMEPVSPTLPSVAALPSSPTVPGMESVLVESTDTETPEPLVSLRGCRSPSQGVSDADSASPIAKRVRNEPRTWHPSMLQISPYVNPVIKVYKSRKQAEAHPVTEAPPPASMQGDRGRDPTEVRNC